MQPTVSLLHVHVIMLRFSAQKRTARKCILFVTYKLNMKSGVENTRERKNEIKCIEKKLIATFPCTCHKLTI